MDHRHPALLILLAMYGVRANAVTQIALFQARAEVEQLAAERERLRIASDLHDLLGHSLSTVAAGGSRWRPEPGGGAALSRDTWTCPLAEAQGWL